MTSATPIHYWAYNGQDSLTSKCFSQLKTVCSARNGATTKAEEHFLYLFVIKMREIAQPVSTKVFLQSQPRQLPCTQHPLLKLTYPSLSHLFWLAHNLQNGLCLLITCGQSYMTSHLSSVIKGWNFLKEYCIARKFCEVKFLWFSHICPRSQNKTL